MAQTIISLDNRKTVPHFTLLDLPTGERVEGQHIANNPYADDYAIAIRKEILLVQDIDYKSIAKSSIVLVEFPTYRQITKVPFAVKSDKFEQSAPADSRYNISNDQNIFIYSYGQTLVCRRAIDLSILWTQKIKPPIGVHIIRSPNENYVAVAIADSAFRNQQKQSYISIYNGKTGAEITQMPICGTEGFALSPDGNLIAVVESILGRDRKEYSLIVQIYDVHSGRILASFEHDRIRLQRLVSTKAVCSVSFTSDGLYLVSSGMNTKVWRLEQ